MPDSPINFTPYDESGLIKNADFNNLNYTNQNFHSLKARLVEFINERFGSEGTVIPNTFNDFVESSIAIMLIESMAFVGDTLSFKIDQIVNELFIDTVTEVENAFRLSKLVGFEPLPPISSRSFWTASTNNVLTTDVVIPTPVSVETSSNDELIRIELFPADIHGNPILDEDIVIPAGKTFNKSVVGLEGITRIDTFVGNGTIAQSVELSGRPVIYESVRVVVDGVAWDHVKYFTDSNPRKEFRVEFTSDYRAFVIFGNNRAGLIPSIGSDIRITYREGGGARGNIVTGSVETQTQVFVDEIKVNIPINLRNHTKGEFGYDGDGIEEIRSKLPNYINSQDRAVSGSDYKSLCDNFATAYQGQIGKSIATLRNHGCSGNIIDIYVLAQEGKLLIEATNQLKVDLYEELNNKKMLTDNVCIRDGSVLGVDVIIDVYVDRFYRKFEQEQRENIINHTNSFFDLNNWDFNKNLRSNDLIKELSNVREIRRFDVTFVTSDENNSGEEVKSKFFEIIRPEDISISFTFE